MLRFSALPTLALAALLLPAPGGAQIVFDWPVRAGPQPEAVLTGAGALFWNPGSLVQEVGTSQEVWVVHVDGPEETGIGGVALSGVADLPLGLRGGIGYWHLGIRDIPRTTDSPDGELGDIHIAEDVGILAVARSLSTSTGVGGALRFQRGTAGGDAKSRIEAEVGVHHQTTLPFSPRVGIALMGLGGEARTVGGVEASLPPLASNRIPLRAGYGLHLDRHLDPLEHRFSLRASWMEQIHAGLGLSHMDRGGGWTPLWMVGADIGRYSLSVLREALANDFGAVHFFRASLRFP